jgi:hypothetical protein
VPSGPPGLLDWLPPEDRVRITLRRGVRLLERGDYVQASRAFLLAERWAAPDERELVRGLVHLAAAGERRRRGEPDRAERQLAHARRRLAPFAGRLEALGLEAP